jgi:DNA-binding protein Fis
MNNTTYRNIDQKLKSELDNVLNNYLDNFLDSPEYLKDLKLYKNLQDKVTKVLLIKTLQITNGNIVASAKILGICRNTLRHYIKAFAANEYRDLVCQNRVTQDKRRKL